MASAEEWRRLAAEAVVSLLEAEGAATQPEMEAKISDRGLPSQAGLKIQPHHITTARQRLLKAGVIEQTRERTRGSRVVVVYMLSSAGKKAQRAAGRKRLLHTRYVSWSDASGEISPPPVPAALEMVVHNSLLSSAAHGYRLLQPAGGEVRSVLGGLVPSGALDNAAYFTGLGVDGRPLPAVTVLIEAKNVRQWIYPTTQELYQLLEKAVRVQRAHPDQAILPVLVCRRLYFRTGKMAKQMGFHVIETWRQYVRPTLIAAETPELEASRLRLFSEVNDELAFNMELHDGSVEQMAAHFTKYIPARLEESLPRWAAVAAHPDVLRLVVTLRDDSITTAQRGSAVHALAAAVEQTTGEEVGWSSVD